MRLTVLPTGPADYAAELAAALASHAEVRLLASERFVADYQDVLTGRVTARALPWPRHRSPANLALVARVLGDLGKQRPDVVHFLGDSVTWLTLALPLLRHLPLVVTVHDVEYHPGDVQSRRVPMATIFRLRRAATALIVHGESLKAKLAAAGLDPPAGIHVVPHLALRRLADLARRRGILRTNRSEGPRRVLFFGRAMAYKGLEVLVRAADRVVAQRDDIRFVVAGTGPELDRLAPELAARPCFEVRDRYVSEDEAAELFATTDLVVLPYVEASQSGVATVAASFGRPVVATWTGELGRLVADTGMGAVVEPGDPEALARAILTVLGDSDVYAGHAAAALRSAETGLLAHDRVVTQHLRIYEDALRAWISATPSSAPVR